MKTSALLCLFLLIAGVSLTLPIAGASEDGWHSLDTDVTENLYDVFMINADDGWIVGDGGTILHWNGTDWTEVSSPTTVDLRGVHMLSADDGWAVGLYGVTIHWNGTDWEEVTSGITADLMDVGATYDPYYYAVGAFPPGIITWDGIEWVPEILPTIVRIRAVDMDEFHAWAVGDSGTILSYSELEDAWSEETSHTAAHLLDVCIVSETEAWAVGASWTIIHYEEPDWEIVTSPMSGDNWFSTVDMVDAADGWAMGYNGTIVHWNGTDWAEAPSPTTSALNSVFMVSADDGWAVGFDGTILRWTGTEWIPEFPMTLLIPFLVATTVAIVLLKIKIKTGKRSLSIR